MRGQGGLALKSEDHIWQGLRPGANPAFLFLFLFFGMYGRAVWLVTREELLEHRELQLLQTVSADFLAPLNKPSATIALAELASISSPYRNVPCLSSRGILGIRARVFCLHSLELSIWSRTHNNP